MKKEIIKEKDKTLIGLDIMLYVIYAVVGYILLRVSDVVSFDPVDCASPLLYMFGFFSLLTYFLNRRKDDYEQLFFGFINIVTATFLLVNAYYPNTGFVMADALLIYSIAIVLNKGYHAKKLLEKGDINFFVKLPMTVILTILGILVVANIYNKIDVGNTILGYYFLVFGLISLLEPLMYILLSNNGIAAWLTMLTLDEKETKKEAPRKVKEIVNKKPIKKITVDVQEDDDEEVEDKIEEPIKEETKEETKEEVKEEETSLEQESKKKRKKRRKKKKTQVIENE